jgi:hypothetical protein
MADGSVLSFMLGSASTEIDYKLLSLVFHSYSRPSSSWWRRGKVLIFKILFYFTLRIAAYISFEQQICYLGQILRI